MKRMLASLALGAMLVGASRPRSPRRSPKPTLRSSSPRLPTRRRLRPHLLLAAAAPAAAPAAPQPPQPAAAAAAAAAPTPNKGDNAWMIVATLLVIMMSIPGLALFYGGLVRSKNMLSVLMQVFVIFSLIVVLWTIYGYSLAFTEDGAFLGGLEPALPERTSSPSRTASDRSRRPRRSARVS